MEEVDKKRKKDGEEESVPNVSGGFVPPASHPIDAWDTGYPVGPTCPPFDPNPAKPVAD